MKLYAGPGTISVAVAIVLFELDLPFDTIWIDFAAGEQTSDVYAQINPKRRVPALILDDGHILTETGAILEYLAAAYKERAPLVPDNPRDMAQMHSVMYYLASTMHVNHAHKFRGSRWAKNESSFADMHAMVPQTMAQSAQYLEDEVLGDAGPYILGDRFTIADAYMFSICAWLEPDGVDISQFPKLKRFMDIMAERAALAKTRAAGFLE